MYMQELLVQCISLKLNLLNSSFMKFYIHTVVFGTKQVAFFSTYIKVFIYRVEGVSM